MNIEFKSTIFSTKKSLQIKDDFSLLESSVYNSDLKTFAKNDIIGIRFGVSWITGYQFTIGRVYCLDIRNKQNEVISVRLKSVYGIRRKHLGNKYLELLNIIIDTYFTDIYNEYLNSFSRNEVIEIESVRLSEEGIWVKKGNEIIKWEDLDVGVFHNYLSLTSKHNSKNYTQLYYLNDWNTYLIEILVKQVIQMKGMD